MIALESPWWWQWSTHVHVSDASELGHWVLCSGVFDRSLVAATGRLPHSGRAVAVMYVCG